MASNPKTTIEGITTSSPRRAAIPIPVERILLLVICSGKAASPRPRGAPDNSSGSTKRTSNESTQDCGGWATLYCSACLESVRTCGVYHSESFPRGNKRGCRTLCVFQRVRLSFLHGLRTQTPLWQKRLALHYVQLLSAEAVLGIGAGEKSVRQNPGGGADAVPIQTHWVCPYARACAPVAQRASREYAIESDPGAETARIARHAWEEEKQFEKPIASPISERRCRAETLLATTILRLQRLEPRKTEREIRLYARQSSGEKTGPASEILAVEQLEFLRNEARSALADGPHRIKPKTHPLKNTKGAAPPSRNPESCPPACGVGGGAAV